MTHVPDRRGIGLLTADVGRSRLNKRWDVKTVQRLLNAAAECGHIRLSPALVADGQFGKKTEAAIMGCERDMLGRLSPTGVIAQNGSTVRALARSIPQGFSATFLSLVMTEASEEQIACFTAPLAGAFAAHDLTTPLRQAHFLAQIGHESGELRYREEIASGAAYEGRIDLGNTEKGDGKKYKGRGLIQLTGRANYAAFSAASGHGDRLVENPEMVATDLTLCVGAAAWFWSHKGLNRFADKDDLRTITRRINGGYNGFFHRSSLLIRCKALFGLP
ncbi:MAG: glycoside hydrolase family 19 protein [Pikeienuella sp.]